MNQAMLDNMTTEEFMRYGIDNLPETFRNNIEKVLGNASEMEQELIQQEKEFELVGEQLYFARVLIEEILNVVEDKGVTRCKDIKETITRLCEESYFEL